MWPSLSFHLLWLVIPHPSCSPLLHWMLPDRRPPPTLRSVGLCWVDGSAWLFCHAGQHPPSEPAWSLHCHQPARQTGEFCLHTLDLFFYEVFDTFWLMHLWWCLSGCAFKLLCVFASKKRQPLPLSPQNYPLHGSEVNGAHPAGFHSGSSSFGVPSHTPPIAGTDTIMGKPFWNVRFHLWKVLLQYLHSRIVTSCVSI